MKHITNTLEFDFLDAGINRAIYRSRMFPEKIFRDEYKYFLFITFDELFMELFFNHMQHFLKKTGEEKFWLVSVNPDPRKYFYEHFRVYGAVEFTALDSKHSFFSAINEYHDDNPGEALIHVTNSLIVLSQSGKWVIFGERESDIAVCAFSDRAEMEVFESIYAADLLEGVRDAADYAYGAKAMQESMAFCRNYDSGD